MVFKLQSKMSGMLFETQSIYPTTIVGYMHIHYYTFSNRLQLT